VLSLTQFSESIRDITKPSEFRLYTAAVSSGNGCLPNLGGAYRGDGSPNENPNYATDAQWTRTSQNKVPQNRSFRLPRDIDSQQVSSAIAERPRSGMRQQVEDDIL